MLFVSSLTGKRYSVDVTDRLSGRKDLYLVKEGQDTLATIKTSKNRAESFIQFTLPNRLQNQLFAVPGDSENRQVSGRDWEKLACLCAETETPKFHLKTVGSETRITENYEYNSDAKRLFGRLLVASNELRMSGRRIAYVLDFENAETEAAILTDVLRLAVVLHLMRHIVD